MKELNKYQLIEGVKFTVRLMHEMIDGTQVDTFSYFSCGFTVLINSGGDSLDYTWSRPPADETMPVV